MTPIPLIARDAVSRRSPAFSPRDTLGRGVGDRSISRRGFLGSVAAVAAAAALPAPLKAAGPWWNPADRDVPIIVGVAVDCASGTVYLGDGKGWTVSRNSVLGSACQGAPSNGADAHAYGLPGPRRVVVRDCLDMSARRLHATNIRVETSLCPTEKGGRNPAPERGRLS